MSRQREFSDTNKAGQKYKTKKKSQPKVTKSAAKGARGEAAQEGGQEDMVKRARVDHGRGRHKA
mgnify:CR=1 FL=1